MLDIDNWEILFGIFLFVFMYSEEEFIMLVEYVECMKDG